MFTCAGVSNAVASPGGDGSGGPGSGSGLCAGLLDQTEPPELPKCCGVSVRPWLFAAPDSTVFLTHFRASPCVQVR